MTRRNLLPLIFTLLSIGLVLFTAWSLNHFRQYEPYESLLSQNEFGPRQFALELSDVELRGRSEGQPEWSVHARNIQLSPDQANIVIDSLDRGVLMRRAKPYLKFVADRAAYVLGGSPSDAGIVHVSGGIRIDSVGPATPIEAPLSVVTARAEWDGYRSLLTLPDRTQLNFEHTPTSPAIALDSKAITWNASNYQLTCPDQVIASVDATEGYGPYHIASKDLLYDEPSGQVRCLNPISVFVPALGDAVCRPLVLDTHQHTAQFGAVRVVADATKLQPPMPTPSTPISRNDAPTIPGADDNKVVVDAPGGGLWDEQTKTLTVKGPVTFHQGDTSMVTIGAVYDRKSDTAKGLSPVTITDPETTVKGDHGSCDFKHHISNITGSIHIDVEPKPDKSDHDSSSAEGEANQPSVLTCDAVVYDYRKKFAITKGTVVIKQKHRTVTADRGTYDTIKHIADLYGNVVADGDDGQHMEADHAEVSLKKGDEWIEVPKPNIITFKIPEEDNPNASK